MVGDVALDAENVGAELEVLRKTATLLEPGGLRTKLLLPNEQIKYLSIDTPGMDAVARRAAAAKALDGATPYAVSDLVFDTSADGDQTHIAAVARETLQEAEDFAVEHRFHPVSFAAVPEDHPYLGEPFFGVTKAAADLLEPTEEVEPDGIAVVVVGHARVPEAAPETPTADASAASESAEQTEGDTKTEDTGKAEPAPAKPAEKAPDAAPEAAAEKIDTADPAKAKEVEEDKEDKEDKDTATSAAPVTPDLPPEKPDLPPAKKAETPPTEKTADAKSKSPAPVPPPVLPPAAAGTAPAVGFASRRSADAAPATALGGVSRSAPPAAKDSTGLGGNDPAARDVSVTSARIPIEPDSTSLKTPTAPAAPAAPKPGFLSRRRAKTPPRPQQPQPIPAAAAPAAALAQDGASEQERMTIFGARKAQIGGKPRYLGLILTAALLVFLAGVAAWAAVFMDQDSRLSQLLWNRAPEVAAPLPAPVELPRIVEPDNATVPEEAQTASLVLDLSEEDSAVLDALRAPAEPQPPVQPTDEELAAKYASTDIWAIAPEVPAEPAGPVDIEDLYLTSIDPISTSADAIALPPGDSFNTDAVFAAVSLPPAAGTKFTLDDNGLVIPTAQGALSPDGYVVYLGAPPLKPAAIPTRFQAEPQDTAIRSAIAGLRPQPRPSDLIENAERAQLDGLTLDELAAYRPALRPQSLQEAAAEAAEPAEPISTDGAVALALAAPPAETAFENATRLAVAASARPDLRPRNFERIVKRAERSRPAEEQVQVASAAAVAPRAVQPSIPSKTSVAKQATLKNALNLREVNLIGVYGKPSNRRALVRLGNGRYQKVVVGDKIDGGRVSAIGDTELRYTKRGRDMVLKMPR